MLMLVNLTEKNGHDGDFPIYSGVQLMGTGTSLELVQKLLLDINYMVVDYKGQP